MNTAVAEVIEQQPQIVEVDQSRTSALAMLSNDEAMQRVMSLAKTMASSKVTVPKHLQGNEGDCAAIIIQSAQWGLNPYAVAQKTHLVNGVLGYEAQLVNAVVQATRSIDGTFHYEYQGDGNTLQCRVGAVLHGNTEVTWGEWLKKSDVTTQNSPLWKTNPKQQLGYLQVKNWARLYCPGAILGVYTPDEIEQLPERELNPRYATGAQVASAALPVIDAEDEERAQLIAELEKVTGQGVLAYADAWMGLTKEQRKLVGNDDHERMKAAAKAADDEKKPTQNGFDDFEDEPGSNG